jgi:L-ascorbate metabolism protein UlaG (beta-lactamase superfamily)
MVQHARRRTRLWLQSTVLTGLVVCLGCSSGHMVQHASNHSNAAFDFEVPNCSPAFRPAEPPPGTHTVDIRYLGAGGLYVGWGDDSILLGPYFSNPGLLRVLLGRWKMDDYAIERGLYGVPVSKVEAIFAGHSHYDHIGDFPAILERAPGAHVYVNRSGAHALAPYAANRTTAFEDHPNEWVWLTGPGGEKRPIRFYAVPSAHAPQIRHFHWENGNIGKDFTKPWTAHRFHQLKAGQTYALVIDLLASDNQTVKYRFYYQDAASPKGMGVPPALDDHPYDLAVLCMASYDKTSPTRDKETHKRIKPDQPAAILEALKPRHVLATHYEDFMRQQDRTVRFVNLLNDEKADFYLSTVCDRLGCKGPSGASPINPVCGPSSPRWTMPLPGEWMRFPVQK